MQLGYMVAFRDKLVKELGFAEEDVKAILPHVEQIVKDELAQADVLLNAFEGNVKLHPFVYIALGTIALSAFVIALVFVAKF